MSTVLIQGGHLVNEGEVFKADLLIEDEYIIEIILEGTKSDVKPDEIINAKGQHVFPGAIDDQVHFREPGLTHKGDIATESLAAIAGGITSFMDMPNVNPPTLTIELLDQKYAAAKQRAKANYAFYMGASNDNLEV